MTTPVHPSAPSDIALQRDADDNNEVFQDHFLLCGPGGRVRHSADPPDPGPAGAPYPAGPRSIPELRDEWVADTRHRILPLLDPTDRLNLWQLLDRIERRHRQ
jgi:hypothetical protein